MSSNFIGQDGDWRKSLCHEDRLLYILDKGILTDVTFLVGHEHKVIRCHRNFLVAGSPVFQAMLTGKCSQDDINIPDLTPEEFQILLKYLYTGSMCSPEDLLPLVKAANEFAIPGLPSNPGQVLLGRLTANNACVIYERALIYNERELVLVAEQFITRNAKDVLDSEGFTKLTQKSVANFVSKDQLAANEEMQIIQAVIRWGKMVLVRKRIEETPANLRHILRDMIPLLRFPQLTAAEFSEKVVPLEILTNEQSVGCFLQFSSSKKSQNFPEFNNKKRAYWRPPKSSPITFNIINPLDPSYITLKKFEGKLNI